MTPPPSHLPIGVIRALAEDSLIAHIEGKLTELAIPALDIYVSGLK